ncbi:MAG: hypothetical protein GY787_29660 [Alteromonadales bacterium]|nr:hypothetical protein [Alteromonadales bacterium]
MPTPMSVPSLTDGGGSPLQTKWHYNKYYIQIASYNELLQNDVSGKARFLKPLKQDQVIVRFCAKNTNPTAVSREPMPNDLNVEEWNALYSILGQLGNHVKNYEQFKYQLVPKRSQFINSSQLTDRYGTDVYFVALNRHYMPADSTEYKHGRANVSFSVMKFLGFLSIASSVNETVQAVENRLKAESQVQQQQTAFSLSTPKQQPGGGGAGGIVEAAAAAAAIDFTEFLNQINGLEATTTTTTPVPTNIFTGTPPPHHPL